MAWIWVLIHNNYVWIKHYIYLIRKQKIYYLNLQHIHGSHVCLHNKIGVLSITIMRTLSNHITKRFFKFNKKICKTWQYVYLSVQCHVTNLRWFIKSWFFFNNTQKSLNAFDLNFVINGEVISVNKVINSAKRIKILSVILVREILQIWF